MSYTPNKGERIIFRLTPHEKLLAINKAKRVKISLSDFCRKAVLEKEVKYIEGLSDIHYDLGKIGANINQIAVAANQGRDVLATMTVLKIRLLEIFDRIEKTIGGDSDSHSQTD